MSSKATYEDAGLMLRLYEARREGTMREARQWFQASFRAQTLEELNSLCPPGSKENAYFRMVSSYWDLAASFITSGILNEELFFQSGRELLFVWERMKNLVPLVRALRKDPTYLRNLETVGNDYILWLQAQGPDTYARFAANVSAAAAQPVVPSR